MCLFQIPTCSVRAFSIVRYRAMFGFFVECYMEGDASVVFAGPQWLRERVPLRCCWCARKPVDRQQRFPPKACAIVAVNSWRPVFFQCWANVLRSAAMIHACLKRMTRASILHAACLQDHPHVVGYVIGEECIKVVSFFFNAVCSCVGTVVLPSKWRT